MRNRLKIYNLSNLHNSQVISKSMMTYCIFPLSYYITSMFTHFYETRRKDFVLMMGHHVLAFGAFWISLIMHRHYSGVISMIMHNSGIAVLETAKAFKYGGHKKMSNIVFLLYVFVFATSRLVLFPQLLYFMSFKLPQSPVTVMQNAQAAGLLCMNVYWTYNALKVVKSILTDTGSGQKVYKDELSSSEVEDN